MEINKSLINRIAAKIIKRYKPKRIVLFGSYAWGKPTKDSDIDLLIVKNTKKRRVKRFVEVKRLLYRPGKVLPVEPFILTPTELERRVALDDPFILKILNKGKNLYGQ